MLRSVAEKIAKQTRAILSRCLTSKTSFSFVATRKPSQRPDPQILVIPRDDGMLVVIDGEEINRPMTAMQMIWLGRRCLDAGLEMMRKGEADER